MKEAPFEVLDAAADEFNLPTIVKQRDLAESALGKIGGILAAHDRQRSAAERETERRQRGGKKGRGE